MRKYIAIITAVLLVLVSAIGYNTVEADKPTPAFTPTANPDDPKDLSGYYDQVLSWENCGGGFECTSLSVPLDYDDPYKQAISISVIRLRTSEQPVGSLILNPGGPGGSGIEYARAAQFVVSNVLLSNFDIVGFDPRGVGESSPIECIDDPTTDEYIALDGTPDDQAEIDASIEILTQFGQECLTNSPELVSHVDTVSAARDIDILRAVLGDEKLNWLGKSYGTFLGATYADLFPQNVGRMLLDGAIDPTLSNLQMGEGQARGFEDALNRFMSDCLTQDDCPFNGTVEDGVIAVKQILDDLDQNPAILDDGRQFTQAMGVLGIVGGLYDVTYGWSSLRPMLAFALGGDFNQLARSVDLYTSRNEDGTYSDNSNDAIMAINCIDRPDRGTPQEAAQLAQQWSEFAPVFGSYLAWGNIACSYWPVAASGTPKTISANGSPLILVVGTTHDPATPYAWAQGLASQLSNSALLTLDGDGHTAYMQGSKCIDEVVDEYFLTGVADDGVICADGP